MPSASSRWIGALLVAVTLIAFWPVFGNEFVSLDDDVYVTANPAVPLGLNADTLAWAFTNDHGSNWHPLTWISHLLDVSLFGVDPVAHHAVSLALHAANVALLYAFLLSATRQLWPSALVALLFGIHPLHVESVAWAAERKDVLSTFFGLLALLAWLRFVQRRDARFYAAALVAFAASLMSKSMWVTLPFVLLLFDVWPLRRGEAPGQAVPSPAARVVEKLPFFALSAAMSGVALWAQGRGGSVGSLDSFPLALRLENALISLVTYLRRTLWPSDLAAFHPYPVNGVDGGELVVAMLVVLGLSWVFVWRLRGRAYAPVGWLFYLGTLVPVIGLVQIGRQANADRYTYVPLIGIFIVAAWGLGDLVPRRWQRVVMPGVMVLLALVLVPATRAQVRVWQDSRTLYEHALAVTSENYFMHYNLGVALFEQRELEEAARNFEAAYALAPNLPEVAHNSGRALMRTGRTKEGIERLRAAVALAPNEIDLRFSLAAALHGQNELDEAQRLYEEVLRLDPQNAAAHNNLGALHLERRRYAEAITALRAALRSEPGNTRAWSNLKRAEKLARAAAEPAEGGMRPR